MATLTVADLDNGKRDLETVSGVANSRDVSVPTRFGQQTLTLYEAIRRIVAAGDAQLADQKEAAEEILRSLGYLVPVPYESGLEVTTAQFTVVGPDGVVYSARAADVPFTSGDWDSSKWTPIQNTMSGNQLLVFNTVAAAEAAAAILPDGQPIDASDEKKRYKVEAGALVFVANLDQLRRDLIDPSKGANLVILKNSASVQDSLQVAKSPIDLLSSISPISAPIGSIVRTEDGFLYRVADPDATDQHLETMGGVKLYCATLHDGLDPRQLGSPANGVDDDAPFTEKALSIHRTVSLGSQYTYVWASVIGIPNQSLYAPYPYEIIGNGTSLILDGAAAGDSILTSVTAKANPESVPSLYTGKVNIRGINFTQRSPSVIINGDRVYNVMFTGNHADAITSVIKSYRPKANYPNGYMQSVLIAHNHFSRITKIVDAKAAFNFCWDTNFCEACAGGVYIDGPGTPAVTGFYMKGGLFEGGGMAARLGGVNRGSIRDIYMENNPSGDTVTEKCYIKVGHGGVRSYAFVIDNCGLYPNSNQIADTDFYVVKDDATTRGQISVYDCYGTAPRVWQPGAVHRQSGNWFSNSNAASRIATRAPTPAADYGVSYLGTQSTQAISAINNAGKLRMAALSISDMIAATAISSGSRVASGTITINSRFMPASNVFVAGASFVIDFTAMGAGEGGVDDVNAAFSLRNSVQIASGLPVNTTYGIVTRQCFSSPTLEVLKNGSEYLLSVTGFSAGTALPNYGAITRATIEITMVVNGLKSGGDFSPMLTVTP